MSQSRSNPVPRSGPDEPNDPPPEQDPTHDVPVYPEGDPPPSPETPIRAAAATGPSEHELPDEGEDDVDDDDLDPQTPHSPPDVRKRLLRFDENTVARWSKRLERRPRYDAAGIIE